jgi:hypothetical protein
MAVGETGDESCHMWLASLPGSLEGVEVDFLQSVGRPLVATLEVGK